jgi:drug/metabolite transporter (DMT)-like permease
MTLPIPHVTRATALQGHAALFSANTFFGLNQPITYALLLSMMTPVGYTFTRMFLGVVIFWTLSWFMGREKIAPKDWLVIAAAGLIGVALNQFLFAIALIYTTPVNYSVIAALTPMTVLVLAAVILKERLTWLNVAGVVMGILGAGLIAARSYFAQENAGHGLNDLIGIGIASFCTVTYAVYLIMIRKVSQKYSPVTIMKWMFLITTIVLIPFSGGVLDEKIYSAQTTPTAIAELVYAILFSSTIAFFLLPYGLKRVPAATAGIYTNLQPIVGSIAAIALGLDRFSWDKPVALVLVILGVYIATKKTKEK